MGVRCVGYEAWGFRAGLALVGSVVSQIGLAIAALEDIKLGAEVFDLRRPAADRGGGEALAHEFAVDAQLVERRRWVVLRDRRGFDVGQHRDQSANPSAPSVSAIASSTSCRKRPRSG